MWNILKTASERDENLGLAVLGTPYVGYFSGQVFEFSSGSFGALCKIFDVKIFRNLLLTVFIQFQPNLWEA